jgi:hypothetical protein
MAQVVQYLLNPEFKPQYGQKRKKERKKETVTSMLSVYSSICGAILNRI